MQSTPERTFDPVNLSSFSILFLFKIKFVRAKQAKVPHPIDDAVLF